MADHSNNQGQTRGNSTIGSGTIVTGIRDLLIIIVAVIAIVVLLLVIVGNPKFTSVAHMVSLLGAVLPVISTITAAAFGVSVGSNVGSQAGQQAGQATARATKQQAAQVKNAVMPLMEQLKQSTHSVHEEVKKLPLDATASLHTVDKATLPTLREDRLAVHQDTMNNIQATIEKIQTALDMLPT